MSNEKYISVNNGTISSVRIEPQKIMGNGNYSYPQLIVPISFNLSYNRNNNEQFTNYTIFNFSGDLSYTEYSLKNKISDFKSESILYDSGNKTYNLCIPLDQYRIKYLEDKRSSDMPLTFRFKFLIAKMDTQTGDIKYFNTSDLDIYIEIPKSHWLEKILPGMGYGKIKLIEIPATEKIMPESFNKLMAIINESQVYFMNGDYNNSVLQCRKALEELLNIRKTEYPDPSFKKKFSDFMGQNIEIPKNSKYKRTYIKNMINSTWDICNKAAHSSNIDFNRFDAELIMINSTTIIAYILRYLN